MNISGRITKHKAVEIILLTSAWPCIIDVSFDWTLRKHRDHAGIIFCLVLFGYKIIEFNFNDTRHTDN